MVEHSPLSEDESQPQTARIGIAIACESLPDAKKRRRALDERNRAPLGVLINALLALVTDGLPQDDRAIQGEQRQTSADTFPLDHQIFAAPKGEVTVYAAEILGGVPGITSQDSFLFVTSDEKSYDPRKGLKAFVVSKNDPSKRYEVPLSINQVDADGSFRGVLGQGHDLIISPKINGHGSKMSLDGKTIRGIDDFYEWHSVVRERIWSALPSSGSRDEAEGGGTETDKGISEASYLTGDSWTFLQKDLKTGQITKFTQSGTGRLGRLEIIQGAPSNIHWMKEVDLPPVSSRDGVSLPDEMKAQIVRQQGYIDGMKELHGGRDVGVQSLAHPSLQNLENSFSADATLVNESRRLQTGLNFLKLN
jgi:hypothetical protein